MKALNIDPTLATWFCVLRAHYPSRGTGNRILSVEFYFKVVFVVLELKWTVQIVLFLFCKLSSAKRQQTEYDSQSDIGSIARKESDRLK